MSAKFSMQLFAVYLLVLGLMIILVPAQLADIVQTVTFGVISLTDTKPAELDSQYGSIVGFFYAYLGFVYMCLAGSQEFARFSVFGRVFGIMGGISFLVILGKIPAKLLTFAAIDAVFGLWTYAMLQKEKSKGR